VKHRLIIYYERHVYVTQTNGTRFSAVAHTITEMPLLTNAAHDAISDALRIWTQEGENDMLLVLTKEGVGA